MVDVNIPGALFKVDSFEYVFFNFLAETYSQIKFFSLTDNQTDWCLVPAIIREASSRSRCEQMRPDMRREPKLEVSFKFFPLDLRESMGNIAENL